MKTKNLLFCLALIAIGLGFTNCSKEEDIVDPNAPEEVAEYTIGLPDEDERYTFECKTEKAVKDQKITAILTVSKEYEDWLPALIITTESGVTVTPEETYEAKEEGIVYTYTFKMPESNITLSVDLSKDDTEYTIDPLPKDERRYSYDCKKTARKNETVTATLTILPEYNYLIPVFTIKTVESKKVVEYTTKEEIKESEEHIYTYTFKMPEENVTTSVQFGNIGNILLVSTDTENAFLWVMNASDPNYPEIWCSAPDRHVGFHFNVELGYEFTEETPEVTGNESGDVQYTFWNPDGTLNGYPYYPCWTFAMPNEPVTVKVHATEKTTYADKEFTGDYKGYQIATPGEQMITGASTLELNLNANASYKVTSTDANLLNFRGEYIMDENNKRFAYDAERIYDPSIDNTDISMFSHGLSGQMLEDGDLFILATDLVHDFGENTRFYYASKEECAYTCASRDVYGTYCLLEVIKANGTKYYLFDSYNNKLNNAEVEFISGTTIGSDAEALISVNGVVVYKYNYTTGNAPVFTGSDEMNGTYTGPNGDLTLNGFGRATIGGQTGSYTLNSNKTLVNVTIDGVESIYVLSASSKSYVVFDPTAWEGPKEFSAITTGTVGGVPCNARITVYVGTDLQGKSTPGQGAIKAEIDGAGNWQSIVASTSAFIYNPIEQTLKFEKILTKTSPAQSGNYSAITFSVSEDLQTLISTHETFYKYNSTSNTINLKDVEIKAVVVE